MIWPDWIKDGVVQRIKEESTILGEFVLLDPLIHSLRWVQAHKPIKYEWIEDR